jgi:hypothetical protein
MAVVTLAYSVIAKVHVPDEMTEREQKEFADMMAREGMTKGAQKKGADISIELL